MSCGCGTDGGKVMASDLARVNVEFLYLDESVCVPCSGTGDALDKALEAVREPLKLMGFEAVLNKIHVVDQARAIAEKFVASPTIRVNGVDIDRSVTQENCPSCGTLAGDTISVDCRTWHWRGQTFQAAPVGKIMEEILRAAYTTNDCCDSTCCSDDAKEQEFVLPDNLEQFFKARDSANPPSC